MYNVNRIVEGFYGLVGFDIADTAHLFPPEMSESVSGLYLTDEHPMLTIDNLQAVSTSNTPHTWFKQKYVASIKKLITTYFERKVNSIKTKSLLDDRYLFNTTGRITDTIPNNGFYVGFELLTPRYTGVTVKIKKIGLQMAGTGDITVYLFHSSNPEPIATSTLTRTKNGGMEWFAVNWELPYVSDDTDAGGSWYVVYDQKAMNGQTAITKNYDWSEAPCWSCSKLDREAYNEWHKWLKISPFRIDSEAPLAELWDIKDNIYTPTTNYGMNLQVSVGCDLTDIILEQKNIFAYALSKQLAYDFLREIYYNANSRVNLNAHNDNINKLIFDIEGAPDNPRSGIRYELEQSIKAIDLNTDGLSKVCLCGRNKGIRVGSI